MITTTAECYYGIKLEGEATCSVLDFLSPNNRGDVESAAIMSRFFSSDIEAIHALDDIVEFLKGDLYGKIEIEEKDEFNPLFISSSSKLLQDSISVDEYGEVTTTAVHGNLFAVKQIEITSNGTPLIFGGVSYLPFELPPVSSIITNAPLLN